MYSWHKVLDEVESVPFCIEDDTGSVEVDVRGATVSPKTKARMATSMHEPVLALSPLTERLREEHGIEAVDERGQFKTLHFVEEVLLIGADTTALGSVESIEGRTLCFHVDDDALLVAEGNMAKQGRAARNSAIGFAVGCGIAFIVGVACLCLAFAFNQRTAYKERQLLSGTLDNTRLVVLADALEEVGCTDQDILSHCRSGASMCVAAGQLTSASVNRETPA